MPNLPGPSTRVGSSRLDRFLVTPEWEDCFPNPIQEVGSRLVSDHFPIILVSSRVKWGPTPFRFENMWLNHRSFFSNVETWWSECSFSGWDGFQFMKKLKFVKEKLKVWNQ